MRVCKVSAACGNRVSLSSSSNGCTVSPPGAAAVSQQSEPTPAATAASKHENAGCPGDCAVDPPGTANPAGEHKSAGASPTDKLCTETPAPKRETSTDID